MQRVALVDFNSVEIHGENFVRDLCERCFVSLSVRMRADMDFDFAVGGELDVGLFVAGHDRTAPPGEHGRAVGPSNT